MKKLRLFSILIIGFLSCGQEGAPSENIPSTTASIDSAQWIIDKLIAKHGGEQIDHSRITLEFRGRQYRAIRQGGEFMYERIFQDPSGRRIHDRLTNEGLSRTIDDEKIVLSAKDSAAYANSVNSVIYFALLPYFLQDEAVEKEYLGSGAIKDRPYFKIGVSFRKEGGGKDFEDEFIYWIHRDSLTMDYLAYNYLTDGGGARFREAYNARTVNGIRFQDYINYKPEGDIRKVKIFDRLFEEGKLLELSRIDLQNVEVSKLDHGS